MFYVFTAFERFNDYVQQYNSKSEKDRRQTVDLVSSYLTSSPELNEIFAVVGDKDIYSKPEVSAVMSRYLYNICSHCLKKVRRHLLCKFRCFRVRANHYFR